MEQLVPYAELRPFEVVNELVGVLEVFGEVAPDYRAVGEEEEGNFRSLGLQRLGDIS